MRIRSYPTISASSVSGDDVLLIDGETNGTRTIKVSTIVNAGCPWPVHSIIQITSYSVKDRPETIWPGTQWKMIAQGRFLMGAAVDEFQHGDGGEIGGEAEHQLTADEIPSHKHSTGIVNRTGGTYGLNTNLGYQGDVLVAQGSTTYTGNTGGGQAHNNLPPYLKVYTWERIA